MNKKIEINKMNNIYKVSVNEYIELNEFINYSKKNNSYKILNYLSNSIIWNREKQKINTGTYFILINENSTINILIKHNTIAIYIKEKDNIKQDLYTEKLIYINTKHNNYNLFVAKTNYNGKPYSIKYYYNNESYNLGALELNDEEVALEKKKIVNMLNKEKDLNDFIDVKKIKNILYSDIYNKTKKLKIN